MGSSMIEVDFKAFDHTISEDLMIRYGSPYFDRKTAGHELAKSLCKNAVRTHSKDYRFHRSQIICGNEAFPETALADSLADLEVWSSWNSGYRAFPYSGKFSRLGLLKQEGKTPSNAATGVLGEIFAGLFAQAGISPDVLVRSVRHWPDFILNHQGGAKVYPFVEAKGFTSAPLGESISHRIKESLLYDFLIDCIAQLNSDPFLEIWGSFTGIVRINPDFLITQTMIRVTPDNRRRASVGKRLLPEPLLQGLVERAVSVAAADLMKTIKHDFHAALRASKRGRKRLESALFRQSEVALEGILAASKTDVAVRGSLKDMHAALKGKISSLTLEDLSPKNPFYDIKENQSPMVFRRLKVFGGETIYMANLSPFGGSRKLQQWMPNWDNATKPFAKIGKDFVWRCGGALFCLSANNLDRFRFKDSFIK